MNLRPTLLVTVCLSVLVGCGTSEDPPSGDTGDTSTTTDTGLPTDSEPA
ncbi:MAG: hypothetical protein RLZZ383_810, partial [Pseudomonadota bacterium]